MWDLLQKKKHVETWTCLQKSPSTQRDTKCWCSCLSCTIRGDSGDMQNWLVEVKWLVWLKASCSQHGPGLHSLKGLHSSNSIPLLAGRIRQFRQLHVLRMSTEYAWGTDDYWWNYEQIKQSSAQHGIAWKLFAKQICRPFCGCSPLDWTDICSRTHTCKDHQRSSKIRVDHGWPPATICRDSIVNSCEFGNICGKT